MAEKLMPELFNYRHILPNGSHGDCVIGDIPSQQYPSNDTRSLAERWTFNPTTNYNPHHGTHGRFASVDSETADIMNDRSFRDYAKEAVDSDDEGGIEVLHGTADAYLDSIKKVGLKPSFESGADAWAEAKGRPIKAQYQIRGRDTSVYITQNRPYAEAFSRLAVEMANNNPKYAGKVIRPVVLTIDIPRKYLGKIHKDEADKSNSAFRFQGSIPPSWIKNVDYRQLDKKHVVGISGPAGEITGNEDADTVRHYFIILVADDAPTTNYNPNHGEHGHFATADSSGNESVEEKLRSPQFKAWFGDWEHHPETASQVVNSQGKPQENYPLHDPIVVYHGTSHGGFTQFEKSKEDDNALYGPGFYFTEDKDIAEEYTKKDASAPTQDNISRPLTMEDFNKSLEYLKDKHSLDADLIRVAASNKGMSEHLKIQQLVFLLVQHDSLAKQLAQHLGVTTKPSKSVEVFQVYLNIRKPFKVSNTDMVSGADKKKIFDQISKTTDDIHILGNSDSPISTSDLYSNLTKIGASKAGINAALKSVGYDGISHIGGGIISPTGKHHRVWITFEPTQIKAVQNKGGFNPSDPNIFNFNPNHGEHGHFASGTWKGAVPSKLHDLYQRIEESDSGFTFSMTTGGEPSTGYVVSPYPKNSWAVDADKLKPVDIIRYVKKNKDLLQKPDAYLGAWHDPASHKVFLDVSVVKQNEKEAHDLALHNDQIAYFNLSTFKSVTVNPKATSGGVTNVRRTESATGTETTTETGSGSKAGTTFNQSSSGQSHAGQSDVPPSQTNGQRRNAGRDRGNEERIGKTGLTSNEGRWQFRTDSEKVDDFVDWLREQFDSDLIGLSEQELWAKYIQDGFQKGAGRAYDDFEGSEIAKQGIPDDALPAFQAGAKQQFLKQSFANPETADKLKMLTGRTFEELNNVTADLATRMRRVLADGLTQGKSPIQIARELNQQTDIGANRALLISRTELIRAHAEGQLHALDDMGVDEIGVAVEYNTTGDGNVCPDCAALQGAVFSIDEAHGLIPNHPNCRCAFIPANVGESKTDQMRSKSDLDDALDDAGIDDLDIDDDRPEDITDNTIIELYGWKAWFDFIANADVSEEIRDDHGRWTKGGVSSFLNKYLFHKQTAAQPTDPELLKVPQNAQAMQARMDKMPEYTQYIKNLATDPNTIGDRQYIAKQHNMTVDQWNSHVDESVKNLVGDKDQYVRIKRAVFPLVMDSGRIKTQFETHTSMGLNSPSQRAAVELTGMAVPKDIPSQDRPVSGYLAPKNFAGTSDDEGSANYGGIVAKLKPQCRDRSTVTIGDSLSQIINKQAAATPLNNPNHNSIPVNWQYALDEKRSYPDINKSYGYIETQTHGGIGLDDIEELAFGSNHPPNDDMKKKLSDHGIKWRIYQSTNEY